MYVRLAILYVVKRTLLPLNFFMSHVFKYLIQYCYADIKYIIHVTNQMPFPPPKKRNVFFAVSFCQGFLGFLWNSSMPQQIEWSCWLLWQAAGPSVTAQWKTCRQGWGRAGSHCGGCILFLHSAIGTFATLHGYNAIAAQLDFHKYVGS